MARQDLELRLRRVERACGPRPLDPALVQEWVDIVRWLDEIKVRDRGAAPMSDEEIREAARARAAEGKTYCRVWMDILEEVWAEQPERPVNLR